MEQTSRRHFPIPFHPHVATRKFMKPAVITTQYPVDRGKYQSLLATAVGSWSSFGGNGAISFIHDGETSYTELWKMASANYTA